MKNNHFTIVITGRNAASYISKCIQSALSQKYDNYEIIIFDACSNDGSYEIALDYENNFSKYISLIRNSERQYQGQNLLQGAKFAIDNSIIINLDSDDYLYDDQVLNKLNEVYQNDIWLTYGGGYIQSDGRDVRNIYSAYPHDVINNNSYREYRWLASHLRTWKKELFLKIDENDLKDSTTNDFYSMAPDLGFMFPMLEMAGYKAKYMNDLLYVYNVETPFNERKINQSEIDRIEKEVRSKHKYLLIKDLK